jgi:hypothetical protein
LEWRKIEKMTIKAKADEDNREEILETAEISEEK